MYYPLDQLLREAPSFTEIPSTKHEKWKFSKLSSYLEKEYQKQTSLDIIEENTDESNFIKIQDGRLISHNIPSCVHIKDHALDCIMQDNPFARFSTCSAPMSIELNIFEDVDLKVYISYSKQMFLSSSLNIILQEGVKAKVYIVYEGGEDSFISHASYIKLENASKLYLCEIKALSSTAALISQECLHLHTNSYLQNFILLDSGAYLHHFINAFLHYKSELSVISLLLSTKKDRYIFSCDIEHLSDLSTSSVLSKQVLKDDSVCVFDATTIIQKNTSGSNAQQSTKALLLSERAQIHSKPHLEIYSDDLSASHGSTVGELDIEALSYLVSRGINEDKARSILILAFIKEAIHQIDTTSHQEKILEFLGESDV